MRGSAGWAVDVAFIDGDPNEALYRGLVRALERNGASVGVRTRRVAFPQELLAGRPFFPSGCHSDSTLLCGEVDALATLKSLFPAPVLLGGRCAALVPWRSGLVEALRAPHVEGLVGVGVLHPDAGSVLASWGVSAHSVPPVLADEPPADSPSSATGPPARRVVTLLAGDRLRAVSSLVEAWAEDPDLPELEVLVDPRARELTRRAREMDLPLRSVPGLGMSGRGVHEVADALAYVSVAGREEIDLGACWALRLGTPLVSGPSTALPEVISEETALLVENQTAVASATHREWVDSGPSTSLEQESLIRGVHAVLDRPSEAVERSARGRELVEGRLCSTEAHARVAEAVRALFGHDA